MDGRGKIGESEVFEMGRWIWVVVLQALVVLGIIGWVMSEMGKEMNVTVVKLALIFDWYPDENGLVLTVSVSDGKHYKFYKLYTNATHLNAKEPIAIVFQRGVPVIIMQGNRDYKVIDWKELKTLENLPEVRR